MKKTSTGMNSKCMNAPKTSSESKCVGIQKMQIKFRIIYFKR